MLGKAVPPHRNGTVPVMTPAPTGPHGSTAEAVVGDNPFMQLALQHWLSTTTKSTVKVKPQVIKNEIWDALASQNFAHATLTALENTQLLERYLWPGYSNDSSNHHALLLALMVQAKHRQSLPAWHHFESRPSDFSSFFRRILSLSVDVSIPLKVRTLILGFLDSAFRATDMPLVGTVCGPLMTVSIWQHMHSEHAREAIFQHNLRLRKVWRALLKRYKQADPSSKAKLNFDSSWLFTLVLDFLNHLYTTDGGDAGQDRLIYCERFVDFLINLQSQLPTRRHVHALLLDLHILPAIRRSPTFAQIPNSLLRDLYDLLVHYTTFPVDENGDGPLTEDHYYRVHCAKLARLQRVAFRNFESKLQILSFASYASLGQRAELRAHLQQLTHDELVSLCDLLGFRTSYPSSSLIPTDTDFLLEVLLFAYEWRPTFQQSVRRLTVCPTEAILYEPTFARTDDYDGSSPLAIPKLNLMYLSVEDFIWRSFMLHRYDSFYGIRTDMEETIRRVKPRSTPSGTRFDASSRMAWPIPAPAILHVGPANVGEEVPSHVRAEIILDVRRMPFATRREWESIRPGESLFLLAVHPPDRTSKLGQGRSGHATADSIGLRCLRTAELVQVQDEKGKPLRINKLLSEQDEDYRPRQRRLILHLDPNAFQRDQLENPDESNIYQTINLVVRRKSRENNFRPILESLKQLALSEVPTPLWFQGTFLGRADATAASYKRLSNRLKSIDFRDTFLDWQHLVQSFPGRTLQPSDDAESSFGPPYVLEYMSDEGDVNDQRPSKKRRRQDAQPVGVGSQELKVSTYKPLNTGPYPADAPRLNSIRFTPTQIEAISSGTQPGLTLIVGPPGTGKTDVATQIINNIYHNFPSQRTLLVAHSNQALNQLFQKIMALDIDERHLLRLGHGEEDLETDANYSKHGRVESFLERGALYLAEVSRLSASIGAPGAHGATCETAEYFDQVYIKPAWDKYWERVQLEDVTTEQIIDMFPFHDYFSNAPQPVFSYESPPWVALDTARGCYRHIEKIFTELADIRPFEVLPNSREKANYLLIKEARIIAMTATHAAMRREEIAGLGFHYDNVVMEEAAQITEIENFVPLAMQKAQDGQVGLQRIVLVGDHLQNAPIVQNVAFRQFANMEQSLFLRLTRMGAPTITLDQQGRARRSIAELYRWRYPSLSDLPLVSSQAEFLGANAGFRYEYQFINVPDYKGQGEVQPTPHFLQNLGEAEYAVAIFMYMRLLGYPAQRISILAMYAGQRALIRDVLHHRCKNNRLFGMPRHVSTVDKFQGEQNDYIVLSLTRTLRAGYIRDLRRMTVALSRARLGLYVLGRRSVFESVFELEQAFEKLFERPTELQIVANEMFPTGRGVEDEAESTTMVGVEHLGQYVFEMTKARVQMMKEGKEVVIAEGPVEAGGEDSEDEIEEVDEMDDEERDLVEEDGDGSDEGKE